MRRVKDLLRSREATIQGIHQTASVHEAVVEFLDKKISSLVVYDGERLTGIFTKNDLVRCLSQTSWRPEQARGRRGDEEGCLHLDTRCRSR